MSLRSILQAPIRWQPTVQKRMSSWMSERRRLKRLKRWKRRLMKKEMGRMDDFLKKQCQGRREGMCQGS